jgi:hypothetical protein
VSAHEGNDRALLVAMPARHLEAARLVCDEAGVVTLPAGGPGDLDDAADGLTVLVIVTEAGEAEVPAATWRAVFEARVPHRPGDPWPQGLPATWIEEHGEGEAPPMEPVPPPDDDDDDDDDDDEGEDLVGPQSFFRVRALVPSPKNEWVHANELVPKQQRGGRTFVPRTPRLIRFVD